MPDVVSSGPRSNQGCAEKNRVLDVSLGSNIELILQTLVDKWRASRNISELLHVCIRSQTFGRMEVFGQGRRQEAFVNFSLGVADDEVIIFQMSSNRYKGQGLMTLLQAALFWTTARKQVRYWDVDGGERFINDLRDKGIFYATSPDYIRLKNGRSWTDYVGHISETGLAQYIESLK